MPDTSSETVLLSAFACAPGVGSEPGVGWRWAQELASAGYALTVWTHARNRDVIERAREDCPHLRNVSFHYLSVPGIRRVPGWLPLHYLYYTMWQLALVMKLRKDAHRFTWVHHLTYGGIRAWSFLFLLKRPFVYGPVGGGEECPTRLVAPMGAGALTHHLLRKGATRLARLDPVAHLMQRTASVIFVKTLETAHTIAPRYRPKVRVRFEIGIDEVITSSRRPSSNKLRVLCAGRLIYQKGLDLVLSAAETCQHRGQDIEFLLVGDGGRGEKLRRSAQRAGLKNVHFAGKVAQAELFSLYDEADVLLFTGLHDSSGNVALEATSRGLPILCLDLGGPHLVAQKGAMVLPAAGKSFKQLARDLADALGALGENPDLLEALSRNGIRRAAELSWRNQVLGAYAEIADQLGMQPKRASTAPV